MSYSLLLGRDVIPHPAAPQTLEESGLSLDLVLQLVLKMLHFSGELTGTELSRRIGLPFRVLSPAIDLLKTEQQLMIVGGGIVGCATAYYLARRGVRPLLLERGEVGSQQSSRNWGFVRQQGRDPAEVPLVVEANRIWQGLEQELDHVQVGFARGATPEVPQVARAAQLVHDARGRVTQHGRFRGVAEPGDRGGGADGRSRSRGSHRLRRNGFRELEDGEPPGDNERKVEGAGATWGPE